MFCDVIDGYKNICVVVYIEDFVFGESFVYYFVYDFGIGFDCFCRRYESEICGNCFKCYGYWCF